MKFLCLLYKAGFYYVLFIVLIDISLDLCRNYKGKCYNFFSFLFSLESFKSKHRGNKLYRDKKIDRLTISIKTLSKQFINHRTKLLTPQSFQVHFYIIHFANLFLFIQMFNKLIDHHRPST